MSLPKSNMKINKNGVQYISNIDQVNYTIKELTRAALRDVSRLLKYKTVAKIRTLPGMNKSKRPSKAIGTWVRKNEGDLQIGMGNSKYGVSGDTWYGGQQELGTRSQQKRGFLKETVMENIDEIIKIQSQYLSAINGDPQSLIDESEEIG